MPGAGKPRVSRRYRKNTLVLETHFETRTGAVTLLDFMPPRGKASDVIRRVYCERGYVAMQMELILRFGYGAVVPWVSRIDGQTIKAVAGPDMVVVRGNVEMHGENLSTVSKFKLKKGELGIFRSATSSPICRRPSPPMSPHR